MADKKIAAEKKIVYIAGPMSGLHQDNYPAFWLAAKQFRAHGYKVLNPAELPLLPDWQAYMRGSVALLASASYIHMLKNWEYSKGANVEHKLALELGIKTIEIPCNTETGCKECRQYKANLKSGIKTERGRVQCATCSSFLGELEVRAGKCWRCHTVASRERAAQIPSHVDRLQAHINSVALSNDGIVNAEKWA